MTFIDEDYNRRDYETTICARLPEGEAVPFKEVFIGEWHPKVAECHDNADAWVGSHRQCVAVRGWVTYASFEGDAVGLTAHSIIKDADGTVFDITPLRKEDGRKGMRFIAHHGDDPFFLKSSRSAIPSLALRI